MKQLTMLLLGMCLIFAGMAQNYGKQIRGKVTDASGSTPLSNVSVKLVGANVGTATDNDGNFSIQIPTNTSSPVLEFSAVGYASQSVNVGTAATLNVQLQRDTKTLEDVVVVGYGTQKRRTVSSAVTSFDAKNLTERPVVRVDQALIGQMAGVQVKQTTGALGKGMSVQVRGTGSITAGNEPLYVIDGFPLTTAAPNGSGNYATGNPLDNMNPNDIESVQVLKDAAAAAIYGSRAANGVVLITTKKGQTGKARISVNSYVGYMERTRKLEMLDGAGWINRATEIINAQWVASAAGRTADQTNEQRRVILGLAAGTVNTGYMTDDRWTTAGHPGLNFIDWQDEAFQKGMQQNHQLSASGGNESVKYFVSGNYSNMEGMVKFTNFTQYSARANVEITPSKKLKIGMNLAPSFSINNDPGVEGKDNILHQMLSFTPVQEDTMGLYPNVGKFGQYRWSVSPNSPLGKLENIIGQTKRYRSITTAYADYAIIKGLNFKTTINFDNLDQTAKSYVPYIVTNNQATRAAQLTTLTSGSYNTIRRQTLVNENTLNFSQEFNNVHDVNVLAGYSYNMNKIDVSNLSSNGGFNSNAITTLNAANGVTGNSSETRNVLLSYFGRVNYSYDNKYLLSASIRRDGSSRFGAATKWGWFPSVSAGWRISDENFMSNVKGISELKLRGSWGLAGNYNIGDYSTLPLIGTYNYTFNGVNAIGQSPAGITNPALSWEKASTIDVGVDVGIWNNRVTASLDYYDRLNSDILLNVPIFAVTGFTSMLSNAGKVRNKGIELEVTTKNITGPFQWNTSFNIAQNSNKVVALAGGQNQLLIPSAFDISHSILQVGQPMYSIYVVKMIGILSAADITNNVARMTNEVAGDPKYLDANKDGKIDENDRVIVGRPTPKYVWGITNSFRYKNFDLSVLVQGQNGGSIYSLLGRALTRTGQGFTDNAPATYNNRWFSEANPGDGRVSKAYSTFGRIKNTDWLYSSDYIRVRNITLGYNLGNAVKMKQLQSARLYMTLENFFGFDKYTGGLNPEATNTDVSGNSAYPEAGDYGGLPLPRSLIFGVNISLN